MRLMVSQHLRKLPFDVDRADRGVVRSATTHSAGSCAGGATTGGGHRAACTRAGIVSKAHTHGASANAYAATGHPAASTNVIATASTRKTAITTRFAA